MKPPQAAYPHHQHEIVDTNYFLVFSFINYIFSNESIFAQFPQIIDGGAMPPAAVVVLSLFFSFASNLASNVAFNSFSIHQRLSSNSKIQEKEGQI